MLLRARWVQPIVASPIEDGAVVVRDGEIAAVGPYPALRQAFAVEAARELGNAILLPGFVNAHTHLDYTAMRGLLDDLPFLPWSRELTRLRLLVMGDDDLVASARWGAVEAARSGVTTLADTSSTGAACRALSEVGLRGIAYQETFGLSAADAPAGVAALEEGLERLQRWASPLVQPGVHPHTPFTVGPALFAAAVRVAREGRLPLSVHLAESEMEAEILLHGRGDLVGWMQRWDPGWTPPGLTPVRYLDELGVLEARPLIAHAVQVDESDAAILARAGATVAHCPKSNAKFGHGFAPLGPLRRAAVVVGLGSDGMASNDVMDPFEDMRAAVLVARGQARNFEALTAAEALRLATLGGAEALGLDRLVGSLEVGKRADLTAVSLEGAHLAASSDPHAALVFAAHQTDVRFTMVDGVTLFDGQRVTTIDEPEARRQVESVGRLLREARLAPHAAWSPATTSTGKGLT